MEKFDVAVIGGGVLGCFAARNLARYRLRVAVFEKNADVCTEISRANTAIIYSGYDNKPGTLKARLCVRANRDFDRLCGELGVPFKRCGSLMAAFGPRGERVLRQKMEQGLANGVPELKLLSAAEALAIEPGLNPMVTLALYAPSTGTVNPWELGIAAIENAVDNGAELFLDTKVAGISPAEGGYRIDAGDGRFEARAIVNCSGLYADKISEMVAKPYFRIAPTRGDYIILDTKAGGAVRHIGFLEPEERGKGATIVPTVDGNVMLGPSEEPLSGEADFSTSESGLAFVRGRSMELIPNIPLEHTIRSFAALRPNPFFAECDASGSVTLSERGIDDFLIGSTEGHPLFINLAGVKTPGLTCANEIGGYVTELLLERLGGAAANPAYRPVRPAGPRFSRLAPEERKALAGPQRIVCRCREVTEEEVRNAIRRVPGATTVDGVKRRTGAGMGRCQGGFCTQRVIEILAEELGKPVTDIRKDAEGSYLLTQARGDRS